MTDERLKRYYELFTDVWKLFRYHSDPNGSKDFWEEFINCSDRLDEKYGQCELYRNFAEAVCNEINRIENGQGKF